VVRDGEAQFQSDHLKSIPLRRFQKSAGSAANIQETNTARLFQPCGTTLILDPPKVIGGLKCDGGIGFALIFHGKAEVVVNDLINKSSPTLATPEHLELRN